MPRLNVNRVSGDRLDDLIAKLLIKDFSLAGTTFIDPTTRTVQFQAVDGRVFTARLTQQQMSGAVSSFTLDVDPA